MSSEKSNPKPLYRDINADDEDPEVMEIESYCVNCEQNVRKVQCSSKHFIYMFLYFTTDK